MSGPAATRIHPSAVIGPGVELGVGVFVGPQACLAGPLTIGDRVVVSAGATLGGPPEIVGHQQAVDWTRPGEARGVVIEADVIVRELVVIHQGSSRETRVGEGTWLLNRSYLAHDVQVGRDCVVSAGTSIGGHCSIRDLVTIGMNAVIHQRRHVGRGAMVGMGAVVSRDVPPWVTAYGVPLRLHGANEVAMQRAGLDEEAMAWLKDAGATGWTDLESPPAGVADDVEWWSSLPGRRPVRSAGEPS